MFACFTDAFNGFTDFDPSQQAISTRAECDSLLKFDRCIKSYIFETTKERIVQCTLEEKDTTLAILRGMFVFDLDEASKEDATHMAACKSSRDQWSQTDYELQQKKLRAYDNAARFTESISSGFQGEYIA